MITATLNGIPLIGSEPVKWTLREGTFPNIETYVMAPDDAKAFVGNPGPYTLLITPEEGKALKVENLYVLKVLPGSVPFENRVMVADRRCWWSLWHLGPRRYNMRRATGVKRLVSNTEFAQPFDTAPDLAYADYSVDSGPVEANSSARRPWVARRIFNDILQTLSDKERRDFGRQFKVIVRDEVGSKLTPLPVEELQVDDSGDAAVNRILQYFPEAALYINPSGDAVVYSRATGKEADIVKGILPEIAFEGHTDLVKNSNIRPRAIHVLFTRKLEYRVNFIENSLASGATVTSDGIAADRMDNVLPLPDYSLPVNGKVLNQGTYITVDDAFRSWGPLPIQGVTRNLDHDIARRAFVPGMDLWEALAITGEQVPQDGTLADWIGRLAALQSHYRTTFGLSKKLMDKVLLVESFRVATINPQTGQRAPAVAFGDYCIIPTQRLRRKRAGNGEQMPYAINRTAYPTDGGTLDSTVRPSPAVVSILDEDQGIIHLEYSIDPARTYEMILPSQIESSTIPTSNIRNQDLPIAFNSVIENTQAPMLSSSFKCCVLLTVTPASPNTEAQLHKIVIKPNDVAGLLPDTKAAALNDAKGPTMEIRISGAIEVARVQWLDARKNDIEKAIGIQSGEPDLSGLVINEGTTSANGGASLNNIALAQAASIYASLVDRYQGEGTGYMNAGLEPAGYVGAIEHNVGIDAVATTRVSFPEDVQPISLFSYLGAGDRKVIMKLVR